MGTKWIKRSTHKKFVGGKTKANIKIRDTNGKLLVDNEDITITWKEYLEVLYQSEEIPSLNNENDSDNQSETILREEFN